MPLTALVCLEVNPLNVVLGQHGVCHCANFNGDVVAHHMNDRQVLFARSFGGVGLQGLHRVAAADDRCAGRVDHPHEIAAMIAAIEFSSHFKTSHSDQFCGRT
ncbi:hypothetical protein SDC9_139300 [bioreactor metagenome]|uniref:Uncharacterized protein n=1 Tax=bioreactor metagenome TaxID=1076179 RepID=A0A645DSD2_9ZZZZ